MIYRVGKTVIWFAMAFGLAACPAERFRHEKYVCKSVSFDLDSIIVNDTDIGGEVKLLAMAKIEQPSSKQSMTIILKLKLAA